MRELVEDGHFVVPYVATEANVADMFTKPLPAKSFYALRNRVMNWPASRDRRAEFGLEATVPDRSQIPSDAACVSPACALHGSEHGGVSRDVVSPVASGGE